MSHSFANNISVLRRWQAHGGGVLPSDWKKFERSNILAAVELKERDPELVSLLDGSADAGLVADAISGKLSSTPPNFEAMQQKAANDRTTELVALLNAGEINLQQRVELENRDPAAYEAAMAKVAPTPDQLRAIRAKQAAAVEQQRQASMKQANANLRNTARAQGLWG